MNEKETKLIIAAILHDIGKVIYREGNDVRKHSISGYDYLKDTGITDKEILDAVKYHHAQSLKNADIEDNSLSYIVYMADNIASATDRRERMEEEKGFEISAPLESVFNILNHNDGHMYYKPSFLNPDDDINYPSNTKTMFDRHYYNKIKANITNNLKGMNYNKDYINSLIEVMEANLSYVPSSTSKNEIADISLFDHVKLTAAIASCIYQYLMANNIDNYKQELFIDGKSFYEKNVFMLYSMDISGIQKFIYTIHSENAMKILRSKSFYIEIMMEHIIDCLLDRLHLSRANLIYSGGGHCYILIPNTEEVRTIVEKYNFEINQWFLDNYKVSLYISSGYSECSSNSLKNDPEGSYAEIFKNISKKISEQKASRYTAEQIINLNKIREKDYSRECRICKNVSKVDDDGLCPTCSALKLLSSKILDEKYAFFTVVSEKEPGALKLPLDYYLISEDEKNLTERLLNNDKTFVRTYGKNKMYTGKRVSNKLWVGNYHSDCNTFEDMADCSKGIKRIGVLRADVDNLGRAFVSGFNNEANNNRYVTLSRTATLSRQLSLFFKLYINSILREGEYTIEDNSEGEKTIIRNAVICYSGGDDLFIVGAWNEIIELAIDIQKKFALYTEGTLTLSAGIGIYRHNYPISVIAEEVADMESMSKSKAGKAAVTLLEDGVKHKELGQDGYYMYISDGTFGWNELVDEVIGEKYNCIREFFDDTGERGINFLYNLLELIRNQDDKINFARIVYILSRLEPDKGAEKEEKEHYNRFSQNLYKWVKAGGRNIRQLKVAMNMYSYMRRDKYNTEESGGSDNAD
jgi:CRISPR-associated protein Cas10/Csm1 subtype III-A